MSSTIHKFFLGLFVSTALFFAGCTTVPETGRRAFVAFPEEQLAQLAATSFNKMKQSAKVATKGYQSDRLNEVGRRIVESARQRGSKLAPPEEWEFVVFEDERINAFAMPGGKVGFYTGIIELFESDDEMAVVMGHEVAHIAAQHGNERLSTQSVLALGGVALGAAMKDQDKELQAAVMAAYGLGAQFGVQLPFSRRDEIEADEIGLIYSANAGYDPRVAIHFWQKMAASKGSKIPEFLSTHPLDETRIQHLRALMPRAMEIYNFRKSKRARLGPVDFDSFEVAVIHYTPTGHHSHSGHGTHTHSGS